MNRRMRTRMYGGVRGRELVAPSYSLREIQLILGSRANALVVGIEKVPGAVQGAQPCKNTHR